MKKEKLVKVCPKCGSTEVIYSTAHHGRYTCAKCAYTGPLFPEITKKEAKKIPYKGRNVGPFEKTTVRISLMDPKFTMVLGILLILLLLFIIIWSLFFS